MKLSSIYFTPQASVQFTSPEYELMLECSAAHYDRVCKDASADARRSVGFEEGFLRRKHKIHINTGHQPVTFDFHELNILAKILEVGHLLDPIEKLMPPPRDSTAIPEADRKVLTPPSKGKGERAMELLMWLRRVMQAMNETTPKAVNDPLNTQHPAEASASDVIKRDREAAQAQVFHKRDGGGASYANRPY